MSTFLSQLRARGDLKPDPTNPNKTPKAKVEFTNYTSLPVSIPDQFLSPLSEGVVEEVRTQKVDFETGGLQEYKDSYAVVIDGLLNKGECEMLVKLAEESAGLGLGTNGDIGEDVQKPNTAPASLGKSEPPPSIGWHKALVNAGRNKGIYAPEYRNSDRIIWSSQHIATRIWRRIQQVEKVSSYLDLLQGDEYKAALGYSGERGERWRISERGLNESLKFLRYGEGQFFKEHRDGTYETEDGSQRSFYTLHLYLNDSVEGLDSNTTPVGSSTDQDSISLVDKETMLVGGATTFHSNDKKRRLDVHPKAGRVLIFQQRGLLHSGDEVKKGVKFTMRSDLMYEYSEGEDDEDVVFG